MRQVLPLVHDRLFHGISHITGGGLVENVPRMFSDQLQAVIDYRAWPALPIFDYLRELGRLPLKDCFQTFNMGVGLVLAVAPDQVSTVQERLRAAGEKSYRIGQLQERPAGERKIVIK